MTSREIKVGCNRRRFNEAKKKMGKKKRITKIGYLNKPPKSNGRLDFKGYLKTKTSRIVLAGCNRHFVCITPVPNIEKFAPKKSRFASDGKRFTLNER